MAESPPPPETFGRYLLERPLARGGMAEVFYARHDGPAGFSRHLVIKRILREHAAEPEFVAMFLDEARLVARLTHPNIVQLYDFGEVDGAYFLAMELVHGPSLHGLITGCADTGIEVPLAIAARICAGVAEGLDYAHRQVDAEGRPLAIVHRDISPSNVLVTYDGMPKILDFGIAKAATQSHITRTGTLKGKLAYMSPEQVNADPVDGRTDIYALGVVLYRLVTGQAAFSGRSDLELMQRIAAGDYRPARELRPDLPPELEAILGCAMATAPADRYDTARDLCAALEGFTVATGGPVTTFDVAELIAKIEASYGEKLDAVGIPGSSKLMAPPDTPTERLAGGSGAPPGLGEEIAGEERAAAGGPGLVPGRGSPPPPTRGRGAKRYATLAGASALALLATVGYALLSPRAPEATGGPATMPGAQTESETRLPGSAAAPGSPSAEASARAPAGADVTPSSPEPPPPPSGPPVEAGNRGPQRRPAPSPAAPPSTTAGPPGRVALIVKPWGEVIVDGIPRGSTPMAPLELAPGPHELRILQPDTGRSTTRALQVVSGETTTVKVDLTR